MTLTILVLFAVANTNGAEKITHILQKLRINTLIPRSLDAIKSYKETRPYRVSNIDKRKSILIF